MWTINSTICFHQLQLSRSCDPAVSGWTVSFQDILAPLHEVVRLKTQLRVCLVFLDQESRNSQMDTFLGPSNSLWWYSRERSRQSSGHVVSKI